LRSSRQKLKRSSFGGDDLGQPPKIQKKRKLCHPEQSERTLRFAATTAKPNKKRKPVILSEVSKYHRAA
jgi:hypothetical protein